MKKIVVANLKMYMNANDIKEYLNNLDERIIYCPTSIFIPYFINKCKKVGIQNISHEKTGAFTGEVSAKQASDIGVEYAIVGHSERRNLFSDKLINEKINNCLENNLKVILCIGEKQGEDFYVKIKEQLNELENINNQNIIIAYEPVWAIGTGIIPSNEDLENKIKFIKEQYPNKVLYGGSVDSKNIKTLNQINIIDGYLIGSASTKTEELKNILKVIDCQ